MHRLVNFAILVVIVLYSAGCATATRVTTTERTAVEMALLTQSAEHSISGIMMPESEGQRVSLDISNVKTLEKEYLVSALEERLLRQGGSLPDGESPEVDLIVEPRVDYGAIDDSDFLIGIPEFTFSIPTTEQTVNTPELAIFSKRSQWGRSQVSLYGKTAEAGEFVFARKGLASQRYYTRWTFLIFFGFRTTNLGTPF